MIVEKLQQFAEAVSVRLYVKRPAPMEQDWRLSNWEFPCFVAVPAQESEIVQETSGRVERRDVQIMALRSTDNTFDTAEADAETEIARTEVLDFAQQIRGVFHVEHLGGSQIWDSANGCLIVGWSLRLRLTELVGESACGGEPDPATIEITENGTYNVLPFGRAVVDVQGSQPAVVEQLDVTPDYDPHTFIPAEGVDGFNPVNVAACPIPQTEALHVTPSNEPQQFTPSAGNVGFSLVDVDAAPTPTLVACPVTPSTSVQHITPPAGADGFSEVDVQAVDSSIDADIQPINIRQGVDILGVVGTLQEITKTPLNITPSTSAQTYNAPVGEAYDPVQVDAVTAAIDANIQAENIKQGVDILGVTGTMQPAPTGKDVFGWSYQGEHFYLTSDGNILDTVANGVVGSWDYIELPECQTLQRAVVNNANTKVVKARKCYYLGQLCTGANIEHLEVGVLTGTYSGTWLASPTAYLRYFEVGQDTDINLLLQRWTAANVIAEGPDGEAELNYNIKTYLAQKLKDNTGLSAKTITFATGLYNILTADTLQAFYDRNWNVAYA